MKRKPAEPVVKKEPSPESRVVRGLLALIEKNHPNITTEDHLTSAINAEVGLLLPRMVARWKEEQVKGLLLAPMKAAFNLHNPEQALQALYQNQAAMKLLVSLSEEHQRAAEEERIEAEAKNKAKSALAEASQQGVVPDATKAPV